MQSNNSLHLRWYLLWKYDKQDQQGKVALNERNPHTTQQQETAARSPGGPETKTGQGTRQSTDIPITKMIKLLR
jgi:hypothetical protein